ncbi:MAG: T9SS type A sorting domain-containing protein, partial [Candidatus Marinimicrobia bacterium]|nr:T9SS type A sorting domain-containing protein [Candidatus Neomarinimicrobiota bacterium]
TGGLVGYIESGTVSNCSSSGSVNGSNYVGGITGQIANGTISCCSSIASVSGSGNYVGGIIGFLGSAIDNSFARGSVNGNTYVGGFAGYTYGGSTIEDCYSTGSVTGSGSVGGFLGYAAPEDPDPEFGGPGATITASFWDSQSSGQAASAAGTAKTTALMKTLSTFTDAGWDFEIETANGTDNYWDMDESGSENNGYPFLSWQNGTETALPVELSNFIAQEQNGSVLLQWITESETENSGFILEKRIFEEQNWERVADYISNMTLAGQGTSTESTNYEYRDKNVQPGCTYQYRLGDVDFNNTITWHDAVEITMDGEVAQIPNVFGLQMAYPNPFNPILTVRYGLTEEAQTTVQILNLRGQVVSTLKNTLQQAGSYELKWQADAFPSGIYLIQLQSSDHLDLRKVLLTK